LKPSLTDEIVIALPGRKQEALVERFAWFTQWRDGKEA
jgi:hypothetical protein